MSEFIYHLDLQLLKFINNSLSNDFFDTVLPVLRQKTTWLPLYLLVIYLIYRKYGLKSLWVIGFAILTVVLCDQISAGVIKPYFKRFRPFDNPEIANWLNTPIGKGSGWSFVSSHATNHFGMAIYFSMVLVGYKDQWKYYVPFIAWAFLIAFSQVYLAFHYPSDVLAGALLGITIGYATARLNCLVICVRSDKKI